MKGLIHKVYCDMYKTDLTVCFCKDTFTRKTGHNGEFGGCVFWDGKSQVMHIYLMKTDDGCISVPDAAHEAFHVADNIFERTGMVVQEETGNEHMAYLVGWVIHRIFDCLDLDNKAEGI